MTAHRTAPDSATVARQHRRWRGLALVFALTLVMGSFTVVAGPAAAAPSGSGTLSVMAPGVTLLEKGSSTFTKVKSKHKVKAGDTVQTDATGLAQINFKDGSVTRLDHDTVFTLEKLVDKTGKRQVESSVSVGQTWNRVQKLSGSETFQQKGNGATAAVLGTAFLTRCTLPSGVAFKVVKTRKALRRLRRASNCQFTLVDGKLQLSSSGKVVGVGRGQSVTVDPTGAVGAVVTLPPDILFTDSWVVQNLEADARAGLAEATGQPTAEDLKQARIEGAWTVTLVVASTTGFRDLAVGATRTRAYTMTGSCTGGTCSITLTRETGNGPRVIPLTYADGVYTGTDPDLGTQPCELDNGTIAVPNGLRNSATITFTPTAAVPQGGLWRATQLSGEVTESAEQVAGGAGQCRTGNATFSLSASR